MNEMKLGYPLPKIEEVFQYLLSHQSSEADGNHHVPFGEGMKQYPTFQVPLDLPRYRLDNTRTLHFQKRYIAENGLSQDYFDQDIWLDELQMAQHTILAKLIDRKGLRDYFEKTQQTDPLILTHDGFVISGNRRLCAYRELYYKSDKGTSKYKRFERVRVVILPKLTDEEIEFIEDYLEQQPDIKDEFSWISRAMGFRRRMKKHGYSTNELSDRSNIKKSEIDSLLENLTLAEQYLKEIGREGDYDLVEKDKYAFEQIEKGRKKFRHQAPKRDLFEKLSFIALQYQEKIGGRMYANIPIIQEHLDPIEQEIRSDFEVELSELKGSSSENSLDDLFGSDESTAETISFIQKSNKREEIFDIISDKINEVKAVNEEKSRKKAVLKRIQKANSLLVEANNIKNHETDKAGILHQLEQIKKQVEEIEIWASK